VKLGLEADWIHIRRINGLTINADKEGIIALQPPTYVLKVCMQLQITSDAY